MKLYTYFRSSSSYRVRIALNLKGVDWEPAFVHLPKGEQRDAAYLAANPQGLVPALEEDDGLVLTQSLAIIEYLDETRSGPSFLPKDAAGRALVRAMAQVIACEIHPINNLRILKYLKNPLGHDQAVVDDWYRHWVQEGFDALEPLVARHSNGRYCFGDQPTLADICLVPQMWNARRFNTDLSAYPTLIKVDAHLQTLDAFARAAPEQQPDAF
ncbi:maleylacetoacetate isomerase [Iodidimonas gelatinilytica]|uniref:Maleylacetoacetate isomerase n=1 Tax=Iodidimonas gelatinilytica TaxID=1236966 RepID=A0A5A7MVH5_9PROT|nr:maleylacetoacetate isomerase [Iodidimonas gelatinilytica]GEQ98889.1 maleylacetoacetate isomerase [Iodidimonas gelatinilytica]